MAVTKVIKTVFQFRRATTAEWELNKDIIPAAGEPCFDLDLNTLRVGNGVDTYENLEPIGGVKFEIATDGKSIVLEDNILKLAGFNAAEVGAQPRKNADGNLEWVVPSTEAVDDLKDIVEDLQSDVKTLQEIVTPSAEGSSTLLERIEALEGKVDGEGEDSVDAKIDNKLDEFMTSISDDGVVNTLKELVDYVADHGTEAADMATDILSLQELVGSTPVSEQIMAMVNESEKKANAMFEHVKYEITNIPTGTLVDYRDKEIRVMVPAGAEFTKQAVGVGGDSNTYYATFKTYAPDNAVGYIEHLDGQVDSEILTDLKVDVYGRKYQPTWLGFAKYDETSGWTYYGKNSTANNYIGWDYQIDWYDADGVVIESDRIRINLSNEACHNNIEPYYMAKTVKGVKVNGTLLDTIEGVVDISVDKIIKFSDEIDVAEDGTLSVKAISIDKIIQNEDSVLVMDGGGAV